MPTGSSTSLDSGGKKVISLEDAARALGLIAILAYLAGVVTIAAYAESLNVSTPSLDLFKTRYILTGIVVLFVFMVPAFVAYGVCQAIKDARTPGESDGRVGDGDEESILPKGRLRKVEVLLPIVLLGLLYLTHQLAFQLFVNATASDDAGGVSWGIRLGPIAMGLIAALAGAFAFLTGLLAQNVNGDENRRLIVVIGRISAGLCACLLAILFTAVYANQMYPFVPDQFGGGHHDAAVLTFTKEGARTAHSLGLNLEANNRTSQPVEILYQDDAQYTVRFVPEGESDGVGFRTAQLDKSVITGYAKDFEQPWATGLLMTNDKNSMIPSDAHDSVSFVYSEPINSATLLGGWDGEHPLPVTVAATEAPEWQGDITITVRTRDGADVVELGRISIEGRHLREDTAEGWVKYEDDSVVLSLGEDLDLAPDSARDVDEVTWVPSDEAEDEYGNACNSLIFMTPDVVEEDDTERKDGVREAARKSREKI